MNKTPEQIAVEEEQARAGRARVDAAMAQIAANGGRTAPVKEPDEWLEGEGFVPAGTKGARKREGEAQRARIAAMTPTEFEDYKAAQLGGRVAPMIPKPIVQPDMRDTATFLTDWLIDLGHALEARRGKQ